MKKPIAAFSLILLNAVMLLAVKKTPVKVEVVGSTNLTQSQDTRGRGGLINAFEGRRTLTDAATVNVIIDGEHATLDCYEHRKGCSTIAPGTYDGIVDKGSIWITYEMPLTHQEVKNHYVVRGSW